jgi:hypothetical protein
MTPPIVIYDGFDGLDLSYRVRLPDEFVLALRDAKARAGRKASAVPLTYRDQVMMAGQTGSRGGYAYSVDTGEMGGKWFFRDRSNLTNLWGARVSARSLAVALRGPVGLKREFDAFLSDLGCNVGPADCFVTRADYAVDMLAPGFEPVVEHFVRHRSTRWEKFEAAKEFGTYRTSGVLLGRMPNRELNVYLKTLEIAVRKKPYLFDIWRASIASRGLGNIELLANSPIWRFELRAGRKALEFSCGLRSWAEFTRLAPRVLLDVHKRIRHASPTSDSNRSRWPNSSYSDAIEAILDGLKLDDDAPPLSREILASLAVARDQASWNSLMGCAIGMAAFRGIEYSQLPAYFSSLSERMTNEAMSPLSGVSSHLEEKVKEFSCRYRQ